MLSTGNKTAKIWLTAERETARARENVEEIK
jgi:hypothetical protein